MSATTSPCCTGFHLLYIYIYIYPQVIFILVNVKMNMFISVHRARVLYYTHTDYICCMSTSAWFFFFIVHSRTAQGIVALIIGWK